MNFFLIETLREIIIYCNFSIFVKIFLLLVLGHFIEQISILNESKCTVKDICGSFRIHFTSFVSINFYEPI
jgi:hypothetical protein